ncbi:cytochrome P450, partial [Mycena latifolia]
RLREKLLSLDNVNPTMQDLNDLAYLDCVVLETLRMHAPVSLVSRSRTTFHDDVIPFTTPFTDTQGNVHDSLRIRKGTMIFLPVHALNRDAEIWGPDAKDFKSPIFTNIPGVWGDMLTFLGGPRKCIGSRFTLMKALLFTLIRGFEFDLAVPVSDVGKKQTSVAQGHTLLSDVEAGSQLPLIVKPAVRF